MTDQPTPMGHLNAVKNIYPEAWKMCDEFRSSRGKDLPKWPAWCFLPISGWYTIVSRDVNQYVLPPHIVPDAARLAALGSWRFTQGIYSFDPYIYREIIKTSLVGEMPVDVFLRMPEWCMYIETPGMKWAGKDLFGFWVHLEWDVNTERKELRFIFNMPDALLPFLVHMGRYTVTEAVDRTVEEARKQAGLNNIAFPSRANTIDSIETLAEDLQPILSLVLYLCSSEPEILDRAYPDNKPGRPKPKKTKKGWRFFPPSKATLWAVGEDTGKKLKAAQERLEEVKQNDGVTPHIRRAHWHGYWVGTADNKKFIYKWLSPITVGTA